MALKNPPPPKVCPVVSRVDIAWICVSTNDGHPLHLDRDFAVNEAGFKDVVVPGHLLIGWSSEYLRDWGGSPESIKKWAIRFVSPVWPGDQVTMTGEIVGSDDKATTVKVTGTAADGRVVSSATATLMQ